MSQFFIPPDFKPAVAWFADMLVPTTLKQAHNVSEVIIKEEDKEMLRSLSKDRLLFFTNHPSQTEPVIAYHIANVMGTRFHYMATRRAFDFVFGLVGRWFQATGTYSVLPGVADRDSMKMTRQILSEPQGKLVIFPEGEPMCSENDNLMPFQPGIIKLGFAALGDARKKDPQADISILPGFIKYVITTPKEQVIQNLETHISEIESALGVNPGGRNLLRRFLMVGRILQEQEEKRYGIEVREEEDYNYRTGRLRHKILDTIADTIKLSQYNKDLDAIQKLRILTSSLELIEIGYPSSDLPKLNSSQLDFANKECIKAYDFITMKRDYLVSYPSAERFYEWLQRFQSLVLGKTPRALGGEVYPEPRKAYVYFAKPYKFGDHFAEYQKNKNQCVEKLLNNLRADMQGMLDESMSLTTPLLEPGDIGGK
jgi:1-acyl-sn-glycerol-3-phosphate acyltransferase